jgi:hypothetical protein
LGHVGSASSLPAWGPAVLLWQGWALVTHVTCIKPPLTHVASSVCPVLATPAGHRFKASSSSLSNLSEPGTPPRSPLPPQKGLPSDYQAFIHTSRCVLCGACTVGWRASTGTAPKHMDQQQAGSIGTQCVPEAVTTAGRRCPAGATQGGHGSASNWRSRVACFFGVQLALPCPSLPSSQQCPPQRERTRARAHLKPAATPCEATPLEQPQA